MTVSLILDLIVQLYTVRGRKKAGMECQTIAFTDLSFEKGVFFAPCTLHRNLVA